MGKLFLRIKLSVSVSALITLAIGLGLTALLFASVRRVESEHQKQLFQDAARLRMAAVESGLADAIEQLTVVNQLFQTVDGVSREQFHDFTAPLLLRYPAIQALSFERLLPHAQRGEYEKNLSQRHPGFTVSEMADGRQRTAAIRDSYYVVDYIEPAARNEGLLGIDTTTIAEQAQARRRSRATGLAAATGLLTLTPDQGWHSGFLVLTPVYRQGVPLDTVPARQGAVVGETAAMFRVDRLINTILGAHGLLETAGITVGIYASPVADPQKLAFRTGPTPDASTAPTLLAAPAASAHDWPGAWLPDWLLTDRADPVLHSFDLAGSVWTMRISQRAAPFWADRHHGSLYALLGGLLSSLLAAAYVYSLVSRRAVIERVTGERTAALQFANLRLSEDIAVRLQSEKGLRLREQVIEVSANAIIICNATAPDYAIEYVNPAFERITGHAAADLIGRGMACLPGCGLEQANLDAIHSAMREEREGRALLRNYRKDGSAFWNDMFVAPVKDANGATSHFVIAQYDISAAMRFEAELEFQANHDILTGLANRSLLRERLGRAIAEADGSGAPLWLAFLDLDRFKFVNDTLGHEAGDTLLKMLAARLQASVRDGDTVARLGGDEFVLVLPGPGESGSGLQTLQGVMDAVAQPLTVQEHEFFLTCSIGVAIYPDDGATAEALIKHADIAMYRAKELGRDGHQFYKESMNQRTLDRLSIEADLRHALERNEFVVHYQPQLDLRSGAMVGMEALLRWQHPVMGMVAPDRFIGLAEEMGLIIPIGAWVIRTVCEQTKAWQDAGWFHLRAAVNLSARQFTQKTLAATVSSILRETGLDPRYLELELTESMVMNDVDSAIATLRNLKALGVHISIDDFGTGYSSLSYLRRFPIDVLKIDQSFVRELTMDGDAAAIVLAIISLAHSLRLKVIAEGVETGEQLAFLRAHGCDQMQGYYFSKPLPAADFEQLLAERRCLPSMEQAMPQGGRAGKSAETEHRRRLMINYGQAAFTEG
jgi:diguanylate cyclase (GGDEF)-like protein/PAS domain S-box-containing protein